MGNNRLKCVAISDLHGYLPKDLPEGDVLCICGDIVPLDYQRDLVMSVAWFCLDFNKWANSLPYKKVIFIAGNHDFFLEEIGPKHGKSASAVMKKLLPGVHKGASKLVYLCDNSVEIEGKRFYGTPWIGDLSNWAFYKPEESTDTCKGLKDTFANIPKKCDVILTHMPPRYMGLGEVIQGGNFNTGSDYGSQVLADATVGTEKQFQYLLCGHVHSGCHMPVCSNGRKLVNVSIKDENYKVNYEPFVFEV